VPEEKPEKLSRVNYKWFLEDRTRGKTKVLLKTYGPPTPEKPGAVLIRAIDLRHLFSVI
jgi:hypothetical protein